MTIASALRTVLALLVSGFAIAQEADPEALALWYRQPAARWEEALPVGNGRLGAMVYGGTAEERLALNEDSIWAGTPFERDRKGAHRFLEQARELFFAGKVVEGQALMQKEFMTERIVRSYQPLGDLRIRFPGLGEVTDYRRELDLDTATATTTFRAGDSLHTRRVYVSPVDEALVMTLECSLPSGIGAIITLERDRDAETSYFDFQGGWGILTGRALQGGGESAVGVRFEGRLHVRTEGGQVEVQQGEHLRILDADRVTLVLTAGTDYGGGIPRTKADEAMMGVWQKGLEATRRDHLAAHQELFRRVSLDLGGKNARKTPTDERLSVVKEGETDPDLLALYFQYGRYLLMSCSRPGSLPANLQGLWNPHMEAPWNCDYHININLQMNYWPAEVTNLAECHEPFFDLVDGIRARGRKTARELYDAPGWVAHHTTDAWHFTSPIGRTVWGLWPTGGAWCTRHLWEHYLYGGDREFLAERAWPVMCEAAEFFLAYLAEDPETGLLVSGPSSSPENRFRTADGQEADTCMGATMDQEIVWDLFTNVLEAAEELGIDDGFVKDVQKARERLSPPRIGADGRLLEWSRPYEEVEPGHRHMSHLYGLHPGRQFTLAETPELVAAARESLDYRLAHGGGHTGWSRAWIVNFLARLRDGDAAHENLVALLCHSTLPNLFDDHPPFQIDGNFGGTAGIAEMLLQSHDGAITLLPALPAAWPTGSVAGLRARGGVTVDVTWKDGALKTARLTGDRDGEVRVCTGAAVREATLRAGEALVLAPKDFE